MNRFLTVLLVALPLLLSAQEKGDIELSIGGGLTLSMFYGSDSEGYESRVAFQAGVTGEYYFSDRWGFKTGAIYDSKGGEALDGDPLKFDYIFVPLYANWHFGQDRNWYVNFGPYLDFLVLAEKEDIDFKDNIEAFDLGFGAGVGRKFDVSDKLSIFVEYQGALGFLEAFENGNKLFNSRSAVNAGVAFAL